MKEHHKEQKIFQPSISTKICFIDLEVNIKSHYELWIILDINTNPALEVFQTDICGPMKNKSFVGS